VLAGAADSARELVRAQLARGEVTSGRGGFDAAALSLLCGQAGLRVESVHGIGVFTEIFPGGDSDNGALAELESMTAGLSPYRDIAARVHVLARKSAA
jgi:S-adenosylmethionine-dependent methyltransferase